MPNSMRSTASGKRTSRSAGTQHYRRKEGQVRLKKLHRRVKLRFKHIFMSFLFLVGFFFILQQLFLFAFSWDKLDIKQIFISCENQAIKNNIQDMIEDYAFGNILLFDKNNLQTRIESIPRIKSVSVKKIFPLSLNISIEERKPFAVLKRDFLYVIDHDGVIIDRTDSHNTPWPLFIDKDNFNEYYREKIELARQCLEKMTPEEKNNIEILDLSENLNIKIKMKDSPTWLILGNDRFGEKYRRYLSEKTFLERWGRLEYVDLRFLDRFFFRPLRNYSINDLAANGKEAR